METHFFILNLRMFIYMFSIHNTCNIEYNNRFDISNNNLNDENVRASQEADFMTNDEEINHHKLIINNEEKDQNDSLNKENSISSLSCHNDSLHYDKFNIEHQIKYNQKANTFPRMNKRKQYQIKGFFSLPQSISNITFSITILKPDRNQLFITEKYPFHNILSSTQIHNRMFYLSQSKNVNELRIIDVHNILSSFYYVFSLMEMSSHYQIFRAINLISGQHVIIKAVKIHKYQSLHKVSEISALLRIHHESIITLHEAFQFYSFCFIVMEYVPYKFNIIPVTELNLEKFFSQLVDAVKYLHLQGMTHNNICPRNILITKSGDVKLSNFSSARMKSQPKSDILRRLYSLGNKIEIVPLPEPVNEYYPDFHSLLKIFENVFTERKIIKKMNIQTGNKKIPIIFSENTQILQFFLYCLNETIPFVERLNYLMENMKKLNLNTKE